VPVTSSEVQNCRGGEVGQSLRPGAREQPASHRWVVASQMRPEVGVPQSASLEQPQNVVGAAPRHRLPSGSVVQPVSPVQRWQVPTAALHTGRPIVVHSVSFKQPVHEPSPRQTGVVRAPASHSALDPQARQPVRPQMGATNEAALHCAFDWQVVHAPCEGPERAQSGVAG
jgi:hypothetical protein